MLVLVHVSHTLHHVLSTFCAPKSHFAIATNTGDSGSQPHPNQKQPIKHHKSPQMPKSSFLHSQVVQPPAHFALDFKKPPKPCPAGRAHYAWGGRSHAFLSCLGDIAALVLPLVGIIIFRPTGGPPSLVPARQGTHATKWPPHAQWARPAGHIFETAPKRSAPSMR